MLVEYEGFRRFDPIQGSALVQSFVQCLVQGLITVQRLVRGLILVQSIEVPGELVFLE